MKRWRSEFEAIFRDEVRTAEEAVGRVLPGVLRYRTKTTKSGEMLESEVFPIWETGAEAKRARKAVTREAQRRLNDRNAVRKLVRLVSCNFGREDLMVTLTYGDERIPGFREVQRDVRNFLRRMKDRRMKAGLGELKYIYSVEGFRHEAESVAEQGELPGVFDQAAEIIERKGGSKTNVFDTRLGILRTQSLRVSPRPHVHMILSGGLDRDAIEGLWGRGWANCKRLQPDRYTGLEAVSRYMVKSWRGSALSDEAERPDGYPGKRWYGSRNLTKPKVTVSDWKMSRRRVAKAVEEIADMPGTIFNQAYPGYELVDIQVKSSEFVSGVYIYARMRKIKPDTVRRC